jgi:hypothetical protein
MSLTFTLATPVNVGSLNQPLTVSSLQLTGLLYTSTPMLAPIGTGDLQVTLTDPVSGAQETINYQDATVLSLWETVPTPTSGQQLGDIVAQTVFAKLIADGKLPAGTLSASTTS